MLGSYSYLRFLSIWRLPLWCLAGGLALSLIAWDMPFKGLLADGIAFYCLGLSLREVWARRKSHRMIWLLLTCSIILLASIFFGLWWFRWVSDFEWGLNPTLSPRLITFWQQGWLLATLSLFLSHPIVVRRFERLVFGTTRLILVIYFVAAFVGTTLMILPWSLNPGQFLQLEDAFFISISALCVTGLSPVNVAEVLSPWGQCILLVLIQIGGLGIVSLAAVFSALTRQRLSLSSSLAGQAVFDIPNLGNVNKFISRVILFTLVAELLGAVCIWLFLPAPYRTFFHALFQSISAFCNAGFSSLPAGVAGLEFAPVRFFLATLIVVGGIGFPVIFEMKKLLRRYRRTGVWSSLSTHAQMTLEITGFFLVVGAVAVVLTEFSNASLLRSNPLQLISEAFFYSVSSRTAGFSSFPLEQLSGASQLVIAILMVVGGSPVSTAGGIKTTTVGIILSGTWSLLRGQKWIEFGRSEIAQFVFQKAVAVVVLYFSVFFLGILMLLSTENMGAWTLTFEALSALSTVGLSLGATTDLTLAGKLIICGMMTVGRFGLLTLIYMGVGQLSQQRFRYSRGNFYVG